MNSFYNDIVVLKIGIVFFLILIILGLFKSESYDITKVYKTIALLVIINLLLVLLTPNLSLIGIIDLNTTFYDNNWETRGQMGDFLAGHFTALAFIGLLISITQMRSGLDKQDEAIVIQKEEMSLQRKEMKESTKSLMLQAKLYEKQNFETTFFKLLELYMEIVNNISHINTNTSPNITTYKKEAYTTPRKSNNFL